MPQRACGYARYCMAAAYRWSGAFQRCRNSQRPDSVFARRVGHNNLFAGSIRQPGLAVFCSIARRRLRECTQALGAHQPPHPAKRLLCGADSLRRVFALYPALPDMAVAPATVACSRVPAVECMSHTAVHVWCRRLRCSAAHLLTARPCTHPLRPTRRLPCAHYKRVNGRR